MMLIRPSAPFIGRFTVALLCVSTFGIAAATDTPAPSPMATSAATTLPTAKPRALRQPLLNLVLPAGTMMRFHSNLPLSSGEKDSGKPFTFTVLDDVVADGLLFIAAGAQGNGTIVLAGRAGANGHEGDLTIRLDDVSTADVNKLVFNDQRIRLNGRNRKSCLSGARLRAVHWVGFPFDSRIGYSRRPVNGDSHVVSGSGDRARTRRCRSKPATVAVSVLAVTRAITASVTAAALDALKRIDRSAPSTGNVWMPLVTNALRSP